MKVLHITTTDFGGAFRAAYNICEAMKRQGIESSLLVRESRGKEDVISATKSPMSLLLSKTRNFINLKLSEGDVINDRLGYPFYRHPLVKEADIIVLHWVNSFISYRGVEKLLATGKPIIWVMHDMWLFTGGCHYDGECGQYEEECRECPLLSGRKNFTKRLLERKRKMLSSGNFAVVGCSEWITQCAKRSTILRTKQCVCIPNPVDTKIYFKKERERSLSDQKVILFGAMILADQRKGLDLLMEAFQYLPSNQYVLHIVGEADQNLFYDMEFEYHFWGRIDSQDKMADIYNQADVYVIPSRQENLSNSVTEAMACGVPVAAFDIGGMCDMIKHRENGYLAEPFDCKELAQGIQYCINHHDTLSEKAREMVQNKFSMEVVGTQYKEFMGSMQ